MKSRIKTAILADKIRVGEQAVELGARLIRDAIRKRGHANIIVATGASQFEMLNQVVATKGIDCSHVTAFHLNEYVGLPITHPASFHYINGEDKPSASLL